MEIKKTLLLHVGYILSAMMFIISIPANGHSQDTPEDTSIVSVSKWHPKMFYVELPNLSLSFKLPYEPDRSGVHNLFFISRESGETLLLDTIEDSLRYYTPFSSGSCYDAVLLYNNGKYVKYNDIIFENGAEVDMRNQSVQPSDSLSEHWKTMRAFDSAIQDQVSDREDMAVSEFLIKGYVLRTGFNYKSTVESIGTVKGKWTTTSDGYFEIDFKDDTEQTLLFSGLGLSVGGNKYNIRAGCGLIIAIPTFGKARKETRNR